MDYIISEQFQKLESKVQNIFIQWWKPSHLDFVYDTKNQKNCPIMFAYKNGIDIDVCSLYAEGVTARIKSEVIPLFTEIQLRKFIEEKLDCRVEIGYSYETNKGYTITARFKNYAIRVFDNLGQGLGQNLLQAYWQIACIVANEIVNKQQKQI